MKILVVDDDRRMVKTTCDILKSKGYEYVAAFSGEEGIQLARSIRPDCVLMDVKMGDITGLDALKQMKMCLPALPVVLVSAYVTDEQMSEAMELGAYAVLTKPINFQMVLSFLALLRKEEVILVVDDDPNFCRTLKDILTLRGFRVQTEADPEMILGRMEKEYNLSVVLDVNLGSVNGADVLQQIRATYPTKPVVMVTGYKREMSDAVVRANQIGAYACLYKPFEIDQLTDLIEEIRLEKLQHLLQSGS